MHGLINKAIQLFVTVTYGKDRWVAVMERAQFGFTDFEPMLVYDDAQSRRLLSCVEAELGRDLDEVLEDMGTFLVSDPQLESLRRLLRFGGVTYRDFLHSLDDLPARTRLAVSDLHLPKLELRQENRCRYNLTCASGLPGFGSVMVGILRALADDYGALVTLELEGRPDGSGKISISLIEAAFAEGRRFDLGIGGR